MTTATDPGPLVDLTILLFCGRLRSEATYAVGPVAEQIVEAEEMAGASLSRRRGSHCCEASGAGKMMVTGQEDPLVSELSQAHLFCRMPPPPNTITLRQPRGPIFLAVLLLLCISSAPATAQESGTEGATAPRVLTAKRISGAAPEIDGRLTDDAWALSETVTDFVQREPRTGVLATEGLRRTSP